MIYKLGLLKHYIGSADNLDKHFYTKHDAYRLSVRKKKLFESI